MCEDIQRFHVNKSSQDKRLYRALVLPNDLKVLLISDHETDKSAAALDVNIGSMSDPKELPGLAHFCEHMLFMGTEKYPDENDYNKFLSQHGGGSNAYTSGEHTNYYFEVAPKHLEGALDRFAQFFLTPLFKESAVEREVKAINLENEKNVANDGRRIYRLQHTLCNPNHDYQKFGTGNEETLDKIPKSRGVVVRDELLKFHSTWYSSDLMGLSILGQESLDQLEAMVVERFCEIKRKDQERRIWTEHPYRNPDDVGKMVYVVPVKNVRQLTITFPVNDLQPFYKAGPGLLLGHLLNHEGKGSLLSELKRRGLGTYVAGGERSGANGFAFVKIMMDLSEEGIKKIDGVITLVFEYLKMLKVHGIREWMYNEYKAIKDLRFEFKDKEEPQVLTGPNVLSEWKPDLIEELLEKLTPQNMIATVTGKNFESKATMSEGFYGIKYLVEEIPFSKLEHWERIKTPSYFHVPSPNEFIPDNLDLVERDKSTKPHPEIIKETDLVRVWFKQDNEFLLPKADINLKLCSPLSYLTPHHANMTTMLVKTFRDQFSEYAYSPHVAGLRYLLDSTDQGLNIFVRGFSQKQALFLEEIIARLLEFRVDPERFDVLKEEYMRNLENFKMDQPCDHAVLHRSAVLWERYFWREERLEALQTLTASDVEQFLPVLLQSLHIEALFHGNLVAQEALNIIQMVEDKLKKALTICPLVPSLLYEERCMALPAGLSATVVTTNDVHKSSCIEIYFQLGLQSIGTNASLDLLGQMMSEPCFDVLRTQEQLGYIVWSGRTRSSGVQGLRILVQSDRHPAYVEGRIESFLESFEREMETMTTEEFDKHKAALIDRRLEKPKRLSGKTAKFWSEITSQEYNFDRDNIEAQRIKTLELVDILNLFRRHIKKGAQERRKLACHVISMAEGGAGRTARDDDDIDKEEDVTVIEDIVSFKAGLGKHPRPPPFASLDSFRMGDDSSYSEQE